MLLEDLFCDSEKHRKAVIWRNLKRSNDDNIEESRNLNLNINKKETKEKEKLNV